MEINQLTLAQIMAGYQKGQFKPSELVASYYKAYQLLPKLNAYVEFFEEALTEAKKFDDQPIRADQLLWAIPGAIKDNFAVKNHLMTCASKVLQGFVSPVDAVVVERLNKAGFINLGRLNMDEMAMGGAGLYSCYGPTLNPLDKNRVSGGSSSGSASAVAANMAAFALGSDTGGSSRLPASYTGVCGFKPSYGALPRSGLAAFSPSLDVPGIVAKTPLDIALVFKAIAGISPADETTIEVDTTGLYPINKPNIKGTKIGFFHKFLQYVHPDVVKATMMAKDYLVSEGAQLVEVDLGLEDVLLKVYYNTACAEAASSLSRYDGARYGIKVKAETSEHLFNLSRSEGFGSEVQRRILMGNYFLLAENYNFTYAKAQRIRSYLRHQLNGLAKQGISLFLVPGFNEANPINAPEEDNYSSDNVGVLANLTGTPSLAMPIDCGKNGLPVSVQVAGMQGNDNAVLQLANTMFNGLVKR
jgi:aspartyl-tRNA(Asn)/glutamyl-tRNA(Gln) amidotransferase subunit A